MLLLPSFLRFLQSKSSITKGFAVFHYNSLHILFQNPFSRPLLLRLPQQGTRFEFDCHTQFLTRIVVYDSTRIALSYNRPFVHSNMPCLELCYRSLPYVQESSSVDLQRSLRWPASTSCSAQHFPALCMPSETSTSSSTPAFTSSFRSSNSSTTSSPAQLRVRPPPRHAHKGHSGSLFVGWPALSAEYPLQLPDGHTPVPSTIVITPTTRRPPALQRAIVTVSHSQTHTSLACFLFATLPPSSSSILFSCSPGRAAEDSGTR